MGCSRQLSAYLRARAGGEEVVSAATASGLGLAEARLTEAAIAKGELQLPEPEKDEPMSDTNVAADQLRSLIERVERLEEEKTGVAEDIRDVYAEAKANGFDTKTMRKVIRLRAMEKHARDEEDALLATYRKALGMQLSLDLL